jgi:signal transduction histidine kinase
MGTHGAAGSRSRALARARQAAGPDKARSGQTQRMSLTDWPVARRLFAVIVAALLMGLVFGGLRVADAENSASQFSRTEQLAKLSAQLVTIVDDLQNERDATLVALITNTPSDAAALAQVKAKTNSDLGPVRPEIQAIVSGGYPAAITSDALAVNRDLSPDNVDKQLHNLFSTAYPTGVVVSPEYGGVIKDIITLQTQVSLGNTDQALNSDVQTLNAFAQAKDLTSQQLALLDQSMSVPAGSAFGTSGYLDFGTLTSLQVDYSEEFNDEAAFQASATPAENAMYDSLLGPQAAKLDGETQADNIEQALFTVAGGTLNEPLAKPTDNPVPVSNASGISYPLFISKIQLDPLANNPTTARQDGITSTAALMAAWDKGNHGKLAAMQDTEQFVADNIVTRATQLQHTAQQNALTYIIITVGVLLIVLVAALLVARSLVLPLRRLRAGALDIASVQLPERVRLLSENPESAGTMEVSPINVPSRDEIGQVARAFDQVHSEAVRLAGQQALLRSSFNAMFVNLSRRSQTLIERLARMIDTLEQHEDDPDRLGSLFSMDHLVTRMRRNSENLLLLAGHDNPRKWSEAIALADVARAATSEIEQYNRVTLNMTADISLAGQAVSDVVHLLAELIENATIFSPKDTQVHVAMQYLASGGVLIEVSDKGIGVSESRLEEMNWRLDNPPTIDVSVSRHMGLFAVARLAERHGVRVRLRPALPQGLSALVWIPDSLIERNTKLPAGGGWSGRQVSARVATAEVPAYATGGYATSATGTLTTASPATASPATSTATSGNGNGNGNGNGYGSSGARMPSGWFRRGQAGNMVSAAGGGGFDAAPGLGGDSAPVPYADRANGDQSTAGLPLRVPKAGRGQGGSPEAQGGGLPGRTPGVPAAGPGGNPLPQRSPDQARSRLAGFQRGTRRAEGQQGGGGKAPQPGEGTER